MLTFMSTHQQGVGLSNRCINDKVKVGSARLRFGPQPRRLEPGLRLGSLAFSPLFVSNFSIYRPTEGGYLCFPSNGAWILKIGADMRGLRPTLYSRADEPSRCLSG